MSFPEGHPSLKMEMTFLPEKCHFQKVLSSLKVETHFQTSCPTSAKHEVHAFLIFILSDLHTEVFQPFLFQYLKIALHDFCDKSDTFCANRLITGDAVIF